MGWGQNGMWEDSSKNQYSSRENCWKRGAWIACRFKGRGGGGGGSTKKRAMHFMLGSNH